MALIDRIKHDAIDDSFIVWKYPSENLKLGSQLVVNQSQEAIFVKNGEALDVFGPGTHTLSTGNIPLLDKLINLPFGGDTPFTAEIWYVNKTVKRDMKWGTPQPIQLMDPSLGFPIRLRSFGKWGFRVDNTRSFISQIVGSQLGADSSKVHSYFIGEVIQKLSHVLSNALVNNKFSILNITTVINDLSQLSYSEISNEFSRFGLEVTNFNIESINIPDEELAKIQNVFEKTMEAEQLSKVQVGGAYGTIKTFETLTKAAENTADSGVGSLMAAGIGLGAGLPLGAQMGEQLNISPTPKPIVEEPQLDVEVRLEKIKQLFDKGFISVEDYDNKKQIILDEI